MKLPVLLSCLLQGGVLASCHADNCLRAIHNTKSVAKAASFCSSLLSSSVCASETKRVPSILANCGPTSLIPNLSSGCSCLLGATSSVTAPSMSYPTHPPPTPPPPYSVSSLSSTCDTARTVYVGTTTTTTITIAPSACSTFLAPPPPPPSTCGPSTVTSISTSPFTMVVTIGGPPTHSATCNFLQNGEFESGDLDGWLPLPATAHAATGAVQTDPSFDGDHLWVSGPSAPAGLMQNVTACVPGPGSIIFEGWFAPPVQDSSCTINMCYGLSDGQPGDCNPLVVPPQSAGWVRAFVNIPLGNPPEGYSVWFMAGCENVLADAFRLFHMQLP